MRFLTETGSQYELDLKAKKIRRLGGEHDPTPRQGKDGEWRSFHDVTAVRVGKPVTIIWSGQPGTMGAAEGALPATSTSLVTKVLQ